ncbi:Flagellar biosynthetic protein FliQ [Buchnera aphidicola (Takecallis arundicolens)]|uniref:flagellar biosynthetic protein FliQ n=1 Tax=Buchnera aphidicola TaxID=9 RepID=UPI00346498D0
MQSVFLEALFYESFKVLFFISLPVLSSVLFIGLLMNIFQIITSINEQTLSFIPKIITVFIVFTFFGTWILNIIIHYMDYVFRNITSSIFHSL